MKRALDISNDEQPDEVINPEEVNNEDDQNEPLLDSEGNPIDDKPKEPTNPLNLDLIKKSLKKLSKTYSTYLINIKVDFLMHTSN